MVLVLIAVLHLDGSAQDYQVMWYNCENLFDCEDDAMKNDESFTPEGMHHWTPSRYWTKIKNLSKVMLAASEWETPALIGLCEIENSRTLNDLVYNSPLAGLKLQYIHQESPDRRGIDVALLYCPDLFKPLSVSFIPLVVKGDTSFKSRDILYCKGILGAKDTLHVFANHWPSKYGGAVQTEKFRIAAAHVLIDRINAILSINGNANILAMGDFNETESEAAMRILENKGLKLLKHDKGLGGSHKYKGMWAQIDYFALSSSLVNPKQGLRLKNWGIVQLDFTLVNDDAYQGLKPFRTYNGFRYLGGYSDHLPIIIQLSSN